MCQVEEACGSPVDWVKLPTYLSARFREWMLLQVQSWQSLEGKMKPEQPGG